MNIDPGLATITGVTLVALGGGLLAILVMDAWQHVAGSASSAHGPAARGSVEEGSGLAAPGRRAP